ncbi:MAG TPA: glycoside hydrolase family 6 protein [Polyangiaceae bacterium]|nr:glycoside hydrolase family 6 protein [Polyangiaceae bacterium]
MISVLVGAGAFSVVPLGTAAASGGKSLAASTQFYAPPPPQGAAKTIASLASGGNPKGAALIAKMDAVPRGVWLVGGSPSDVASQVTSTLKDAKKTVPVLVLYNIPGRDCGGYSAGGAQTTADYEAWIAAIAGAIGNSSAVVVLEPDAIANLPSDCGYDPTGQLTADRYTQLAYAVGALEALPGALVYLDAGHSEWQSVGTIASRLVQAGVGQTQGFFLNVSNFQPTPQLVEYGTWVAKCIYFASNPAEGGWRLGHYDYCASQYYPANPNDFSTWTLTDQWYTQNVDNAANPPSGASALTHFVVDTSRNGASGGNTPPSFAMTQFANAPYDQSSSVVSTLEGGSWCNPPGAGLGAQPTASTGNALVDAELWVKVPGESDGQCDAQGGVRAWDYSVYTQPGWPTTPSAQATFDPLWGQVDPAAGVWFPAQALQLAQNANPAL